MVGFSCIHLHPGGFSDGNFLGKWKNGVHTPVSRSMHTASHFRHLPPEQTMFPPNSNPSSYPIQIKHHQTRPSSKTCSFSLLFSHFKNPFVLLSSLFSHSLFLIFSPFVLRFIFPPLFSQFTHITCKWTEPNPSWFSFPFSNFPYFIRVFRLLIPFWFQPYHRSSNKTESNWIENEKRK